jgi:hypothetical protein
MLVKHNYELKLSTKNNPILILKIYFFLTVALFLSMIKFQEASNI